MPMKGRYLVDKDGFEYGYNEDMARHTNLYAVMEDGRRVSFQGGPSLKADTGKMTGVLGGDRMPTEQELMAAKQLVARYDDGMSNQIAMSALAKQEERRTAPPPEAEAEAGADAGTAPDAASRGKTPPPDQHNPQVHAEETLILGDYVADAPAPPPIPKRRIPPPPTRA
jgi:hypothetical protein